MELIQIFLDNISLISKNKLLNTLKILKNDFVFCYVGRVVKIKGSTNWYQHLMS